MLETLRRKREAEINKAARGSKFGGVIPHYFTFS
jgi:hypothetical protein